jgi:poly-gamma-glutamate capsule biosynthesis protein CapA/YwtB (metallophosphatase superfamily)
LLVVGAGGSSSEAYAPAIVSTPGGTVAFLGLSQVVPAGWAATSNRPGVASAFDVQAATNAVRAARGQADHVVVMIHAGVELAECPSSSQRSLVAALRDAGAEVVAGGHPHVLEALEPNGSTLVDYSLGNFVWYSSSAASDPTGLLAVELGPGGVTGFEFVPARIDGNGSPQPLYGQPARDLLAHLASLRTGAGRC